MASNMNINERKNDSNLIKWNCQGIRNKKDEILEMIQLYKPAVIALQETILWQNTEFCIPNYSMYKEDGYYNNTPHGGIAILIHQSIPYQEIALQTTFQAVVVRVLLNQLITICSIYIPRSKALSIEPQL